MKNYKVTAAFSGTAYHGFQRQENGLRNLSFPGN